jgi:predicted PurR-regulated permease PerM
MAKEARSTKALEHFAVIITLKVLALTFGFTIFALLAWRLRLILLLVLISLFIAALLNPAVLLLTRRGMRRTAAVLVVYALVFVLILGIGFTFFNTAISQATHFAHELPTLVRQAQQGKGTVGHLLNRFHLANYVQSHSSGLVSDVAHLGKPALAVGKTVLGGVTSVITIMFLSFFILLEAPHIMSGLLRLFREDQSSKVRNVLNQMSRKVTGFMIGDLATSVIAGIVSYIVLVVTGVPFAALLAIWTALVDFLPLVGGLLAGIPVVGVAFLHSVPSGIITLIVFLVYQQIENHILNPIIISRTLRLNPLWVLLSVILGAEIGAIIGSTFGAICGAIFALPAAGAIQVALRELVSEGFILRKESTTRSE